MILQNKKTGEIIVFSEGIVDLNKIGCKNVAEMMEQGWEDYEEPKECYYIDPSSKVGYCQITTERWPDMVERAKELGIGFDTEEEAKKAVEKLKTITRLRKKGFKF